VIAVGLQGSDNSIIKDAVDSIIKDAVDEWQNHF